MTSPVNHPPQSPPSFSIAPSTLLADTETIINATKSLEDALASSLTPSTASFTTLVKPLLRDDHLSSQKLLIFRIFSSVAPSKDLRDASREAEQLLAKAHAESLMRTDIAALVAAAYQKHQNEDNQLDSEEAYALFKLHRAYQNAGAGISNPLVRQDYVAKVAQRNEILVAARKQISEADDGVFFSRGQLAGVPSTVLDSLKSRDEDDFLKVTFKRGHLFPVMKHALSARTRKTLHYARERRFPENVTRLEEAVRLRHEIAQILGFENHAALKMEDKMAPSVEAVIARLTKLKTELKPLATQEIEALYALKKAYLQDHATGADEEDDVDASRLNPWDWSFFARIQDLQKHAVDSLLISEYFEVQHSLKGMLLIFEELFGMRFVRVDDASTWHDDVAVYAAWDAEDQGGSFLGYLYLDVYAREGKYAGAHCSAIQPGFTQDDNTRHFPSSSLICSFIHTPSKPTLLQHSELKTMFHELGHAIHKLVTRTAYSHGTARDFVEIPSILLENWIWVPAVLRRLGKHYSHLSDSFKEHYQNQAGHATEVEEKLPGHLAEALARTKHVGAAHAMLHQVFLALFDLNIHSAEGGKVDTTTLWNKMKTDVVGLPATDGFGQASFAHPFRAYDAAYFTYALSKVYATDLWVSHFKADPMQRQVGLRYRQCVLQPGGGQPEGQSLKNFLGREPNDEAYYSEVSVSPPAGKETHI
ncbi:hypothetical protein B0T10DRAFT_406448 [Thelonectria olida]|uniref:Peptidase M3A/M3B catalytic domain-containing protein n=1 Tax=Thelonectria olida TaxID=1576542 RepID=A0A9P8W311_9HYPO|nr:hypothetical protein B0T10DRAFT_406448 [Thelonectria olida]